jgi:hypothetical protein
VSVVPSEIRLRGFAVVVTPHQQRADRRTMSAGAAHQCARVTDTGRHACPPDRAHFDSANHRYHHVGCVSSASFASLGGGSRLPQRGRAGGTPPETDPVMPMDPDAALHGSVA